MRMTDERVMRRSARREMILLTLGVLVLCGLCFGKAYHMDDPLVVWTAQRIAAHPADFYGFDVNWYGFYAPMDAGVSEPAGRGVLRWRSLVRSSLERAGDAWRIALDGGRAYSGMYLLARLTGWRIRLPAAVLALVSPGVLVSMGQ